SVWRKKLSLDTREKTDTMEHIIGIDLGTTNSEVAFQYNGKIEIIEDGDDGIVPSVVGLDENDVIIVGRQPR
ncbi:Hsp70 family protein, partial [Desulfosarcina sp.]|uniref:Hsp70 family protein n=1 Tax=Desulfosarcina sp. TaxID=2027861 RepID=UPI0029A79FE1